MTKKNYSKGYSLIELVIYIALFVILSMAVMQSLISIMKTYSNAQSYRTIQQNGELVMERTTRELRQADTLSTAGSTFGTSPGVVTFSGQDVAGVPYTGTIGVSNGKVQVTIGGVTSDLTNNTVVVSSLIFSRIQSVPKEAVKMILTLTTAKAPFVTSSFYTTVILRE